MNELIKNMNGQLNKTIDEDKAIDHNSAVTNAINSTIGSNIDYSQMIDQKYNTNGSYLLPLKQLQIHKNHRAGYNRDDH
jgi:hypothetical protein